MDLGLTPLPSTPHFHTRTSQEPPYHPSLWHCCLPCWHWSAVLVAFSGCWEGVLVFCKYSPYVSDFNIRQDDGSGLEPLKNWKIRILGQMRGLPQLRPHKSGAPGPDLSIGRHGSLPAVGKGLNRHGDFAEQMSKNVLELVGPLQGSKSKKSAMVG